MSIGLTFENNNGLVRSQAIETEGIISSIEIGNDKYYEILSRYKQYHNIIKYQYYDNNG
ncbi:MAG: hypothetical protein IKF52_00595 [Clostridia bacterium]|nr:hypothetical protein [Clostridia bacterium]